MRFRFTVGRKESVNKIFQRGFGLTVTGDWTKKIERDTQQLQNAWFPYDRCRSNFLFVSYHQRSQWLRKIAGIESESISEIVKDRQRSQRFNGKHTSAAIATIPAIIWKSKYRDCNDRKNRSDRACPAISMIPAILWKSILSECHDRSDLNDRQRSYGNWEWTLFWEGDRKIPLRFHIQISELLFRRKCASRDNFLERVSRGGNICWNKFRF